MAAAPTVKVPLNIDFMGKRRLAVAVSVILVLVSLASLVVRGLNFGIDFTGGTLIEVDYGQPVQLDTVRSALGEAGYSDAVVQHFGAPSDVLIRVVPREGQDSAAVSNEILDALRAGTTESVTMRRVEFVGPQVGDELTVDGGMAMIWATLAILVYVTIRFEKRFALGSVVALVHDVIITLGVFSVLQLEFDLTVLAAILAVIGYSLNDTIVIFDRVRENFRRIRKGDAVEIVNTSINQTMARTLVTSGTTLLVLIALFFLGGDTLRYFALALIVGILVGTYSTIYVATAAALKLGISRMDLMSVQKEGTEAEDRP